MEWQYKLLSSWFNEHGEKAKSISSLPIEESIIENKNIFHLQFISIMLQPLKMCLMCLIVCYG